MLARTAPRRSNRITRPPPPPSRRSLGRVAALLALYLAAGAGSAQARDGPAAAASNERLGARLVHQSAGWIGLRAPPTTTIRDLHVEAIVQAKRSGSLLDGPLACWWRGPDRFRLDLGAGRTRTTKILRGSELWIGAAGAPARRVHGTPEAQAALAQMRTDARRVADLARWITFRGLQGPGATLRFEGERVGLGRLAGRWLEVVRRAPAARALHLWFAYARDGAGRYRATFPGIVRIEGDARQGIPTEDLLLARWTADPGGRTALRFPHEIEGWHTTPGSAPTRFLRLQVRTLEIDTGIPDARFAPRTR